MRGPIDLSLQPNVVRQILRTVLSGGPVRAQAAHVLPQRLADLQRARVSKRYCTAQ